jgi:hypothetical protein
MIPKAEILHHPTSQEPLTNLRKPSPPKKVKLKLAGEVEG